MDSATIVGVSPLEHRYQLAITEGHVEKLIYLNEDGSKISVSITGSDSFSSVIFNKPSKKTLIK